MTSYLISHVEETDVVLLEEEISNSLPLIDGEIAASRVVSASVHDEYRIILRSAHVSEHSLHVDALWWGGGGHSERRNWKLLCGYLCGSIVVVVELILESRALDDRVVVGPSRIWDVTDGISREVLREEFETNAESTSSREHLRTNKSISVRIVELITVSQLHRGLHELRIPVDWQVLVVHVLLVDGSTGLGGGGGIVREERERVLLTFLTHSRTTGLPLLSR